MQGKILSDSNRTSYTSTSSSSTLFSLTSDFLTEDRESPVSIVLPTISSEAPNSDTSSVITACTRISIAKSITSVTKTWFPRVVLGKIVMGIGSSAVDLVSEYALKKQLNFISSRNDLGKVGSCVLLDVEVRELEDLYQSLLDRDYRGDKLQLLALKLRLSIVRLLLNVETPNIFSRMQKNVFQKVLQDLDQQMSSNNHDGSSVYIQARELRQGLLLKVADEFCSNSLKQSPELATGTFLDGALVVEVLCKELAYSSGDYTIQSVLERVTKTERGFQHIVALSSQRVDRESVESGKLIFDCVSRLLSFDNVFSHSMAIRIFAKLAQQNQDSEIYALLTGPTCIGWLVERLSELSHKKIYTRGRWRGRTARAVESYCSALLVACIHGFTNQVVKLGTVPLLLRLIKIFTIRDCDPKVCSQIEENRHDDVDVERDQIACCALISYLLEVPNAKKRVLLGSRLIRSFNAHSNRLLSDQKLLSTLAIILKQIEQ